MNYPFKNMGKDELFAAWETFLREEKEKTYSVCRDTYYESDFSSGFISQGKAFRFFAREVLGEWFGDNIAYYKAFGVKADPESQRWEIIKMEHHSIGGDEFLFMSKELAETFKVVKAPSNSMQSWVIEKAFNS